MSVAAAPALQASRRARVPSRSAPAVVRVAIAGCGTVGSALAELLLANGLPGHRRVEIVKVLVRDRARTRRVSLRPGGFTTSLAAFLTAPCDVVVEAMRGVEPARTIVAAALVQGRRVVTANKALIAAEGASLANLAERFGGALDFEGAVGGCIPVVRALRSHAAGVGVTAIRGVLNGTANFVLDRVALGSSPDDAIRDAQAKGFAEADPGRDLDGRDAANKVAILAWLAFGIAPHMLPVSRRPLDDALTLASSARALGARVIQFAECVRTERGLIARVEPALIGPSHDLACATAEWNAVTIDSRSAGTILFAGRGAGGHPTAGALHGDLGASSAPLPRPHVVHVAGDDDRSLRWVIWTRATDTDLGARIGSTRDLERLQLTDGAWLLTFESTPALAEARRAALAEVATGVALARDLR